MAKKKVKIWVSITGPAGKRVFEYYDTKGKNKKLTGDILTLPGDSSDVEWQRIQTNWKFLSLLVEAGAPVSPPGNSGAKLATLVKNYSNPGTWKYLLVTSYGTSPDPKIVNPPGGTPGGGGRKGKPKPKPKKRAASKAKKAVRKR